MEHFTIADAPAPVGAYSHAVTANGLLYTSGFGPTDPATGERATTVAEQTRQVLRNIGAVLRANGLDYSDVVKSTVHLQNLIDDFREFDTAYREFFVAPYPVRTTVGSDLYGILVEIDVVASLERRAVD